MLLQHGATAQRRHHFGDGLGLCHFWTVRWHPGDGPIVQHPREPQSSDQGFPRKRTEAILIVALLPQGMLWVCKQVGLNVSAVHDL